MQLKDGLVTADEKMIVIVSALESFLELNFQKFTSFCYLSCHQRTGYFLVLFATDSATYFKFNGGK